MFLICANGISTNLKQTTELTFGRHKSGAIFLPPTARIHGVVGEKLGAAVSANGSWGSCLGVAEHGRGHHESLSRTPLSESEQSLNLNRERCTRAPHEGSSRGLRTRAPHEGSSSQELLTRAPPHEGSSSRELLTRAPRESSARELRTRAPHSDSAE